MLVQVREGTTTILRVGAGPQFLSIRPVEGNTTPRITHYGLGVEVFNVDRIMTTLAAHGVAKDPDGIVCQLLDVSYCGGSVRLATDVPRRKPHRRRD